MHPVNVTSQRLAVPFLQLVRLKPAGPKLSLFMNFCPVLKTAGKNKVLQRKLTNLFLCV